MESYFFAIKKQDLYSQELICLVEIPEFQACIFEVSNYTGSINTIVVVLYGPSIRTKLNKETDIVVNRRTRLTGMS